MKPLSKPYETNLKKLGLIGLFITGVGGCAGPFFLNAMDTPITIESRESKTIAGLPIYNQIRRISTNSGVIWMMNQSHYGLSAPADQWERLAIEVNKKQATAEFYQLKSGSLNWTAGPSQKSLRVACFMCHSNGPRAIRPNFNSEWAKVSFKDQLRIAMWNLEIKLSGRIKENPNESLKDRTVRKSENPFRFRGRFENETLQLRPCVSCHNESGILGRGFLTRQNFMAARFLMENQQMPPAGISLTEGQREEILAFFSGR